MTVETAAVETQEPAPAAAGGTSAPVVRQSVRERVRNKALTRRTRSKVIDFEGEKLLIEQPSANAYAEIDQKEHAFKQHAHMIIACTFACDETGAKLEPLFEAGDLDAIMEMSPKDPLISAITAALNQLNDIKALEAEATKSP